MNGLLTLLQAFTFQNAGRAAKSARRNMDIGEKKLHVPRVDRTPIQAPPIVVAVVGPPGVSTFFMTYLVYMPFRRLITLRFCRVERQHL